MDRGGLSLTGQFDESTQRPSNGKACGAGHRPRLFAGLAVLIGDSTELLIDKGSCDTAQLCKPIFELAHGKT